MENKITFVGELNEGQEKSLKEMKDLISKWIGENEEIKKVLVESKAMYFVENDADILRFLRARKFDVKKAWTMWETCIRSRVNFQGMGVHKIEWDR
jgi:hypothetical protein